MKTKQREWVVRNRDKVNATAARWRRNNPERYAYAAQKNSAKARGIEWCFTFSEWLEWWGTDYAKRGCTKGSLVMARHGDVGAYEPSNVSKCDHGENAGDARRSKA